MLRAAEECWGGGGGGILAGVWRESKSGGRLGLIAHVRFLLFVVLVLVLVVVSIVVMVEILRTVYELSALLRVIKSGGEEKGIVCPYYFNCHFRCVVELIVG